MFVQQWGPPDGPSSCWRMHRGVERDLVRHAGLPGRRGWRVVAVDLPPFGFTQAIGPAPAELDYRRAAQAQRCCRSPCRVERTGRPARHSFGSGPALETAMREPARVRQLVSSIRRSAWT